MVVVDDYIQPRRQIRSPQATVGPSAHHWIFGRTLDRVSASIYQVIFEWDYHIVPLHLAGVQSDHRASRLIRKLVEITFSCGLYHIAMKFYISVQPPDPLILENRRMSPKEARIEPTHRAIAKGEPNTFDLLNQTTELLSGLRCTLAYPPTFELHFYLGRKECPTSQMVNRLVKRKL